MESIFMKTNMPYLLMQTDFMITMQSEFCNNTYCSAEHVSQISINKVISYQGQFRMSTIPEPADEQIPELPVSSWEIFMYAVIWVTLIIRFYEISKKHGILFGLFWLLAYATLLLIIDIIRTLLLNNS